MAGNTTTRGRRFRDERGAAIVEFSLVIGIFLMIVYGLISFGVVLALKHSITNAAHDGARAAIGASAGQYETTAEDKVVDALSWLDGTVVRNATDTDLGRMDGDDCDVSGATTTGARCIVVTITYPYEDEPIIPPLPFIAGAMPKTVGSTATVLLTYD